MFTESWPANDCESLWPKHVVQLDKAHFIPMAVHLN
jgi:hypothetical protein